MKSLRLFALGCAMIASLGAHAQEYPSQPIRVMIGFPPGGGADILGRVVTARLSERLGQPVIVENRGGASGQIAADATLKAPADGYTIMLSTVTTFSILPLLTKLRFDPLKDFVPITLLARAPNMLVVHPSVPANSVAELIAYAKANPGKLMYASPGVGTPQHLAAELFKSRAGVDMRHVPYKGSGQSITDLVAGLVHLNFDQISVVDPFIKEGKLRPLAVTTAKRASVRPDLPTIQESGLSDFDLGTWWGFHAPAGTPDAVVQKLSREIAAVLREDVVSKRFAAVGADVVGNTPKEFDAFLRTEAENLRRIAEAANLKAE